MTVRRPRPDAVDRSGCKAKAHGTPWHRYKNGCICPDAIKATRRYEKLRRVGVLLPGYVPIIGTARRLQALAAMGYGAPDLAELCSAEKRQLAMWRRGDRPMIHRDNAMMVARLYLRIVASGQPGACDRSRRHASRMRWASPLQWDGHNIDDPEARPLSGRRGASRMLDTEYRRMLRTRRRKVA